MGAGKSSIGRRLAALTQWSRYDTDEMIRKKAGRSIAQIFAVEGEEHFRELESETVRELPADRSSIIVTGGGILLRKQNAAQLRRLGFLIYLRADEKTLFRRVSRRATRPLLQTENPRARLHELLETRTPLYEKYGDAVVDTAQKNHDEVAEAVLQAAPSFASR